MSSNYAIVITKDAEKQISKLQKPDKKRVLDLIESLGNDPRPHGYKKLEGFHGEKIYRIHAGHFRIFYLIEDGKLTVYVVEVVKRNEKTYKF
jgi:mRNA interferase RelE/StbE